MADTPKQPSTPTPNQADVGKTVPPAPVNPKINIEPRMIQSGENTAGNLKS
jgi:hypothetical protein